MSSEFTLYHNPRCSKSRAAFDLLEARGIKAEVVKYLDKPDLDNQALLEAIAAHPALLERPILTTRDKAAIGRPLENIEALLD